MVKDLFPGSLAHTAVSSVLLVWLGVGAALAQTELGLEQLYAAAKSEPPLVWYQVPLSQPVGEKVAASFMAKYPGLKVTAQRAPAQTFFQKVSQEIATGTPGADVFTSSVTGHLAALKSKSDLLCYAPRSVATMIALPGVGKVDPDGCYYGTLVYAVTLVYNTKALKEADAPHSLAELAEPKWSGKVAVPNPGTSGTFGVMMVQATKTYGIGYLDKLAKNKAVVLRSLPDVVSTVAAGESPVGIAPASIALEAQQRGQPIDVIYQTDGVLPAISVTGVIKKTKSPNAAKLFMEFLHSDETSRVVAGDFNESLHADVPPAKGLKTLDTVKTALPSDAEVDKALPGVIKAWREAFGM